jgi:hypothetical protein
MCVCVCVCKFLFLRMRDLGIWDDVRKFYYPVVNGWSVVELFCDPYSLCTYQMGTSWSDSELTT